MSDDIMNIDGLTIQQGPLNDRVYLMSSAPNARDSDLPKKLLAMAQENGRGKVLAKVPFSMKKAFLDDGYVVEARVRGMFGREDGIFVSHFLDDSRDGLLSDGEMSILHRCVQEDPSPSGDGEDVQELDETHAGIISSLLDETFQGYPFPVHDVDFIRQTMDNGTRYFGLFQDGDLVSLASAECDAKHRCAEITDMATMEDERGNGLSRKVLVHLQGILKKDGYRTAYTIARSRSAAVNTLFSREGYHYAGSLRRNTFFGDGLENMNVWHRRL